MKQKLSINIVTNAVLRLCKDNVKVVQNNGNTFISWWIYHFGDRGCLCDAKKAY